MRGSPSSFPAIPPFWSGAASPIEFASLGRAMVEHGAPTPRLHVCNTTCFFTQQILLAHNSTRYDFFSFPELVISWQIPADWKLAISVAWRWRSI